MNTHRVIIPHPFSTEAKGTFVSRLTDIGLEHTVASTPSETLDGFKNATIAICPSKIPDRWLEAADTLEWVHITSSGYDRIDLDSIEQKGIVMTNAAGVHAQPIAEQVIGSMLAFERQLLRGRDQQSEGLWFPYHAGELASKTIGIIGLGSIGSRVAEVASAIGCRVIGSKRDTENVTGAVDSVYGPSDLDEILADADYLVVACPLTDRTRGLIGKDQLQTLSREAVVVNIARGEIIDEEALVGALQSRSIAGAALDVFDEEPLPEASPLWDLPNVLITPHMAGSTPYYWDRNADIVEENYQAISAGDTDSMRNRIV